MSTATRLRRRDEECEIVVLERGNDVSFANCGLAYYLGGVITDRDDLLLQTPGRLAARFRIDVRTRSEVTSIDTNAQTVTVAAASGDYLLRYDDLVLATGASPTIPDVPGNTRMLALRSLADTDHIAAELAALAPGDPVVVVGGGYIGLELAENLVHRGLHVTLLQRADHVLASLDSEMAVTVEDTLRAHGVDVRLGAELSSVTPDAVTLADGTSLPARLVLAATGVTPDSWVARAAGIRTTPSGAIVVDDQHHTSAPHVYAVGDVAEKVNAIDGEPRLVTLAGPANREGRYLADTLAGDTPVTRPALGTSILGLWGTTVATVGATERELSAAGRGIRVVHTHPASHAGYYPGAESMSIKLIVDATTDLILGAQAIGGSGVDKRIDVIATAMTAGLTASALADLELAYAPQFGSAKDPINMLGYVARNLRDSLTTSIQWHELADELDRGAVLVDVRTPTEYAAGAIDGSINIPLDELRDRAHELGSARVVVHCQVGQRGHTAANLLTHLSFNAVNLDGGYRTWLAGERSRHTQPIGAA